MTEIIRQLEASDLHAVSDLYQGRKSVEELKWLFQNPNDSSSFNAFVAVNPENEIIGVIGYVLSNYFYTNKKNQGSIPISWKIKDRYKGMAGVLLFKKVIHLGDFGITIAGSDKAKDLYRLFKYEKISEIQQFYKILKFNKIFNVIHRKSLVKTLGFLTMLLPSYFKNYNKSNKINFTNYSGSENLDFTLPEGSFQKEIDKDYINWLLSCPLVKSKAFIINHNNQTIGICVLYIKNNKGRIVHIHENTSEPEIKAQIIEKCITYLKNEGCSLVDALAHNPETQKAFLLSGFINIKIHSKPLYLKDPKNIFDKNGILQWNLQYSEGDKAYRNF